METFRCAECRRVVTMKDIESRGACACGGRRMTQTRPTAWERFYLRITGRR